MSVDEHEQRRAEVIRTASQRFRELGISGTTSLDLIATTGVTQASFYRRYGSKRELAELACADAFEQQTDWLSELETTSQQPDADLINSYLSVAHRDDPAHGCPIASLAVDVARMAPGTAIRATFADAVREFVDTLARWRQAEPSHDAVACRDAALVELATLVGALTLARATEGDEISRAFLAATLSALRESRRPTTDRAG